MDHKNTSFYAPLEFVNRLDALVKILGIRRSEFIRDAVERHLETMGNELIKAQDRDQQAYQEYLAWMKSGKKARR